MVLSDSTAINKNSAGTNSAMLYFAGGTFITGGHLHLMSGNVPATKSSTGRPGEIAFESGYMYYCYRTDAWARTALTLNW